MRLWLECKLVGLIHLTRIAIILCTILDQLTAWDKAKVEKGDQLIPKPPRQAGHQGEFDLKNAMGLEDDHFTRVKVRIYVLNFGRHRLIQVLGCFETVLDIQTVFYQ